METTAAGLRWSPPFGICERVGACRRHARFRPLRRHGRAVMVVRFHIVLPAAKQRSFTVRLPILLGRGEEAKFRIQHDLVSRKHCEFFERHGQVYVRDLGSTNGTFLNDEQVPVSTKTVVRPGAVVRVGGLSFSVEYEPPAGVDSSATVAGQQRSDPATTAGESRLETGEVSLSALGETPDFKIEQPQPLDEAAAVGDVTADAVTTDESASIESAGGEQPLDEAAPDAAAAPNEPEGFAFLADAEPAEPTPDSPAWPSAEPAAEPDDDQLNEFFKGLK